MDQGQPNPRFLKVTEVAKMAGCSPDTIRAWADKGLLPFRRTPGNQRLFLEADVVRFVQQGGSAAHRVPAPAVNGPRLTQPGSVSTRSTWEPPRLRVTPQIESSPLEPELEDAAVGLELLRIQREREAVARSMQKEAEDEAKRQEEEQTRLATAKRLEEFRRFGRETARDLPANCQARVAADLEGYVCPTRFPAALADADAWAFVRARVERHRNRFRESEARAAETEHEEHARAEEIERRRRARAQLVASGRTYAFWETFRWDSEGRAEALRVVERELAAQVRWDWTEDEVKELVDDVLYVSDDEDKEKED